MIEWAVAAARSFAVVMLALIDVMPRAFTSDPAVVERAQEIWPLFALMQPPNGAVFALDGILIGAGDTRYLMWAMLAASLGVFVPIALASLAFDWGIVGVWFGLLALIVARLATSAGASEDGAGPGSGRAGSRPSSAPLPGLGTLAPMATTAQSVAEICAQARRAALELATLSTATKNAALEAMADALEQRSDEILEANPRDMEAGEEAGLHSA